MIVYLEFRAKWGIGWKDHLVPATLKKQPSPAASRAAKDHEKNAYMASPDATAIVSYVDVGVLFIVPPRAEQANLDPAGVPPRAVSSWRRGFPFELVRYTGANRLKVDIDYRAADGRRGPRRVEPYSLRRTRDGNWSCSSSTIGVDCAAIAQIASPASDRPMRRSSRASSSSL